jgi:2-oxoisovalerate dehydrogenase E1 component
MLEHKGLYWSKIKGTEDAKTIEPDDDYIIPFGKGRLVQEATEINISRGKSLTIITYGMGVYWAKSAAKKFDGQIEIIDLRTIAPIDEAMIFASANKHGKCLIITEEPVFNGFAQSIAARISENCFKNLDAPVRVVGSENLPAIPLNSILEKTMLPNADKVEKAIADLLHY